MILRKVFGDKSRFAVEIMHDPIVSGPHMIVGFFLYWVNDTWIGDLAYDYLTHTLTDMRDAGTQEVGRRAAGSLCALTPAEFIRWWDENLWLKESPEDGDSRGWSDLWDFHRRLWLNFGGSTDVSDKIYLLECNGIGRMIWYPRENAPAVMIEDDICRFETVLKDAHDYLSALHEFDTYKHYLTDQQYGLGVAEAGVRWYSIRLRTIRRGAPHGGEAIADHLFLYRSPKSECDARACALVQSIERDAVDSVECRLAETAQVAADGANLDGIEAYRACPVLNADDRARLPPGTAFRPEQSTPRRQQLMSLRGHVDQARASTWFSVQIRMALMVEGKGCEGVMDYVHIVRAADFDAAFDRALAIGRSKQRTRLCYDHPPVLFQFVEVRALNLLGAGEPGDGAIEIHVESPVDRLKADWTPPWDEEARVGFVSRDFELGLPDVWSRTTAGT